MQIIDLASLRFEGRDGNLARFRDVATGEWIVIIIPAAWQEQAEVLRVIRRAICIPVESLRPPKNIRSIVEDKMCREHRPWLEESEFLNTAECLYFEDRSAKCLNPDSEAYMQPCPTHGRAPWEMAARERS